MWNDVISYFDYHETKCFSISVGIDAMLGVRYYGNEYNYRQMKLSVAYSAYFSREKCAE